MSDEIFYTNDELRSYLPSGWELAAQEGDGWDAENQVYRLTVNDEVDHDWPVKVTAADVEQHGRMEALRQAMEATQFGRLGWRTKGLLGWRLRRA